jgi:proprotein convertase subtilisin/kexin type 5
MPLINATDPTCVCQQGNYYNSVTQLCESCYLLCQNCIGPTNSDCTGSCKSISFVTQTSLGATNKCECNTHYYYNSGLCYECHPLCLDCTGPSEVGQCISCGSDIRVIALGVSPSLSCLCKEHSYYNSSQKACVECHPLCGNCTDDGPLKCTSFCTAAILNVNSTDISVGICSCNYHYYYNQSLKDCSICHHFCGDCIGESSTQCSSVCNTNYTNINKTASSSEYECKCIDQYFFNSSASDCRQCHPLCGDCSGYLNTECISYCHPTKLNIVSSHPTVTSTKCVCDYHYFYNSSTGICDLCHPLCGDCTGSTQTECLTECSQLLSNVNTISITACSCIPHYYYNTTLKLCVKCHSLCFDCIGDGNDQCLSCGSPKIVMNTPGLCECFSHYFYEPDREVCVECHSLCLECSNISNSDCLLSCNPQIKNLLDLNISTCECKDGYFYDGVSDCTSI